MTRMKLITDDINGRVYLSYTDERGERAYRTYSTTSRDGFGGVIRLHDDRRTSQVCERLSSTGRALSCTRAELPAVIRREYRAMRRAEAALDRY